MLATCVTVRAVGHAEHFLSRLSRLDPHELELALRLYRNVPIVQQVLARAGVAEGTERVALALIRDADGPHVVVTRAGDFVTCLAAGMTTGELRVVPRDTLDYVLERAENRAIAETLVGKDNERQLLPRLMRPYPLSREEYLALDGFRDAFGLFFLVGLVRAWGDLRQFAALAAARHVMQPEDRKALVSLQLRIGQLTVLLGPDLARLRPELHANGVEREFLTRRWLRVLPTGAYLRCLWTVARLGKDRLALLKESPSTYTDGVLADALELIALGLGQRKLTAEVRKYFEREPKALELEVHRVVWRHLAEVALVILDAPEALQDPARRIGAKLAQHYSQAATPGPYRFDRPEDVPADLARSSLSLAAFPLGEPEAIVMAATLLPFVARTQAEQLFLPEDVLQAWGLRSYAPERAKDIEDFLRKAAIKASPVTAAARPGRNEPCSCGSGLKFKRCCGAA